MTEHRRLWAQAKAELTRAVIALGFPAELADLMAQQLHSPNAMDRMTAWLRRVRPRRMEIIADELLAVCADTETWRQRIQSREAQAGYRAWLSSEERLRNLEEHDE